MADGKPTPELWSLVPEAWKDELWEELSAQERERVAGLDEFLRRVPDDDVVPAREQWFACLEDFPPEETAVIIVGQDPYPIIGDAIGVSFAVAKDRKIPRSLVNVMKVARASVNEEMGTTEVAYPMDRTLSNWRRQGVLMLNVRLTTEAGKRDAHARKGWEVVTSAIMRLACKRSPHVVALLWGNAAHAMSDSLRSYGAEILRSSHPSPLGWSRSGKHGSFKESLCFFHVNQRRRMKGLPRIAWEIQHKRTRQQAGLE